jgi:hypothetical protein
MADRINQLRRRSTEIAAHMVALRDERKAHSLAAAFEADKKALAVVTDADLQLDRLAREAQTITSAIETAEALLKQDHAEAEAAERTALAIEAHKAAQAVCALNAECDDLMLKLAECFQRRQVMLVELARTGIPDATYIARLSNKLMATRAACCAGLHKYLDLTAVSPVSHLPLAATNPQLLVIGLPPEQ